MKDLLNNKNGTGGGALKRKPRLHSKKHLIIGTILTLSILLTLLPLTVYAVQNIFTNLGRIEDIRFDGAWIDQVVYQGTVIWERAPYLQELAAANCPTERTLAIDARNDATYWVRKIGNFCWMETNLAYAGGGNNAYGDATTPIQQGSVQADYTLTAARYFVSPGTDLTFRPNKPSLRSDGTAQYGYLYNFCAVMNHNPDACQRPDVQPNQSVNGGTSTTLYNICPKGWRLPVHAELFPAYDVLDPANPVQDLLTNGLYTFSGSWLNGGFSMQGEVGRYWSSQVEPNNNYAVRAMAIFANGDFNTHPHYKTRGAAVRCIAD